MSKNLNNNLCSTADTKWDAKKVEEYFLEVMLTLRKLPPVKQRGYISLWPSIIYTPNELLFQEKVPMQIKATPEAITRLERTFGWMTWLTVEERKLIWRRAARVRWKIICRELGCSRTLVWKKWLRACNKIASKLNSRHNL